MSSSVTLIIYNVKEGQMPILFHKSTPVNTLEAQSILEFSTMNTKQACVQSNNSFLLENNHKYNTFHICKHTTAWFHWPFFLISNSVCPLMGHHDDCLLCGRTHRRYQQRWFVSFMEPRALLLWHHSQALIGHQMAALIGFWPKLCGLNHWLSAALDTDPAHLHCPTNTLTHTHTHPQIHTCRHG